MVKNKEKKKSKSKKLKTPFTHDYDPNYFFNRETSWLEFNRRVLNEACDERTPPLERIRFLSIYTTNLDEFVMKRVGGLKRQRESDYNYLSIDGLTAQQQLDKIREYILKDNELQENTYIKVIEELKKNKISLLSWKDLNKDDQEFCNQYFINNIFPILTPLSVDPGKPFPFISNLSYSFGIFLNHPIENQQRIFSRVKVPDVVNEWVKLEGKEGEYRLINTSEIIRENLHHLYRGMNILEVMPFRVTRNADWEHDDEDTEDLLELVEESINERRLQEPIRIEVLKDHSLEMLRYLMEEMELKEEDLYVYKHYLDFTCLSAVADLDLPLLKHPDWRPITPIAFQRGNIFDVIKEKDRLVHHPYHNFSTTVEKLITQASSDKNVLSIKMTLYRTGDNSPFIKSLIRAAENGKQVVCLIELKARFDEKRNIEWAKKMEQAGVHVVYGVVGLKTHTKISQVVRREAEGHLLTYTHIATGNYNSKTARLYTDLGLLTVNQKLSNEINEVFNYLTGTSLKMDYKKLLISPINAKSSFIQKIKAQSKKAKEGNEVSIIAKMNSLEDVKITDELYKASQAGVKITLFVRGFCCLRAGVQGLSENIKVISIIGRFLEHSRIFYFSDVNKEGGEYYIGSADWMHRNMHGRVEVMTPIYDQELQVKIAEFLEVLSKDERLAWDQQEDGHYIQRKGKEKSATHYVMMKKALKESQSTDL